VRAGGVQSKGKVRAARKRDEAESRAWREVMRQMAGRGRQQRTREPEEEERKER
jgi:hypothetical protein